MAHSHAAIIGGGAIGASCAYALQQAGWRTTIVDRGRFGGGCSHANCGLVTPSHAPPLCLPGAVGKTLKMMLRRNSAFKIGLRWDPGLWRWLLRFKGRCNERDMRVATAARCALLNSSRELFDVWIRESALDCEWQTRGGLFVYQTAKEYEAFAATNRILRDEFDLPADRYDGDRVCELEPALKSGLAGGWFYPQDAHLRPDKLMRELQRVLVERGADIREHCDVRGFAASGAGAASLDTEQGPLVADVYIVAAGALSPMFAKQLGCEVPIQPGKGYSITMPRPERCPTIPMVFPEDKVAVTPMESCYRLGSMMEFVGYDSSIKPRRLENLSVSAAKYLHTPTAEPVQEHWTGWRPMTYDGIPILDRSPRLGNVYLAAGHNMLGISMAPATGQLLRELITGETPHIDPAPYRVARFR